MSNNCYSPRTYGNRTNNTWTETVCDANGANCSTDTYYITVKDPGCGGPKIPFVGGASGELAGEATVYKRNDGFIGWLTGQSGDEIIGVIPAYGDDKGKLINNTPFRSAELERKVAHFSTGDPLNRIKNHAIITTKKGMMANKDVYGVDVEPVTTDPKVAQTNAEKLRNSGTALPDDESTNTPTPAEGKPYSTRNKYGIHYYPLDISASDQDVIKIDMVRYVAAGLNSAEAGKFGSDDRVGAGDRTILGSVILPIPGGIKDNNKVDWGDNSMNAAKQAMSKFAIAAITEGSTGAAAEIGQVMGGLGTKKGDEDGRLGLSYAFAAAAVSQDFNALLGRQEGKILNPNMELLFNSPSLRPFDFSFLLAPRSKKESQAVAQIIRFFKQGMAVQRTGTNLFLKSPNTFQLTYKHKGEEGSDHPYLNKFKECALRSCSINYTPDQAYSTYIDGAMTAYTMTLSFQELVPIYEDDYEEDETTASTEEVPSVIGY